MSIVCPHCKSKTKEYDKIEELYGSPLMICEKCNSECLSNKREIALSGVSFFDKTLIRFRSVGVLGFGLGLNLLLVYWYIEGELVNVLAQFLYGGWGGIVGMFLAMFYILLSIPVGIWSIIKDITTYRQRKDFFKRERQQSIQRCSDEEYVNKIRSLGYKIKNGRG